MSRDRPEHECIDLPFGAPYVMADPAEVALEDYARTLSRARGAEAIRADEDPKRITGVHLCGLSLPLSPTAMGDIEAFARDLQGDSGNGLGWS